MASLRSPTHLLSSSQLTFYTPDILLAILYPLAVRRLPGHPASFSPPVPGLRTPLRHGALVAILYPLDRLVPLSYWRPS